MRTLEAALAAVLALTLSGCVIGKKPQTVAAAPPPPTPAVQAPPPEPVPTAPLSVPQTQVMLPKLQTLTQEAIDSTRAPEEVPYTPPTSKNSKRGGGRAAPQQSASAPRLDTPPQPAATGGTSPVTIPPAAVTPPAETPDRPIVQDIVTEAESARMKADTARFKQEITQRLAKLRRRLSTQQEDMRVQINSFVKSSDQALQQGNTRLAYELVSKALVLAKALSDAR